MQIKCPPLSDALIDYLDAVFPDHALDPTDPKATQHFGSVQVIRHLKMVKQTQEETP